MNKLALFLAIIAGVAGLIVSFLYLQQQQVEPPPPEPKTAILVAKSDLEANHVVAAGDLSEQTIPSETFAELARTAIKPAELPTIVGRRLGGPLPAGNPILYSNLVSVVDMDFAPDKRAITLEIGSDRAVAGMIIPGDRVDIIITRELPADPPEMPDEIDVENQQEMMAMALQNMMKKEQQVKYEAEVLLSDVEVMAVGQRLRWNREQLFRTQAGGFKAGGAAPSFTFALPLEDALTLIEAQSGASQLTLLLRSNREPGGLIEN